MFDENIKYIQIGDWCFELKAIKALKVDEYGKPYQAIANCSINGNKMYIDGLLTKDEDFSKKDFLAFHKLCQMLGLESCSYHRFSFDGSQSKEVQIPIKQNLQPNERVGLKLVKQN